MSLLMAFCASDATFLLGKNSEIINLTKFKVGSAYGTAVSSQ